MGQRTYRTNLEAGGPSRPGVRIKPAGAAGDGRASTSTLEGAIPPPRRLRVRTAVCPGRTVDRT